MRNLNLYTYYDKSLADINRELLNTKSKAKKNTGPAKLSRPVVITIFAVLFVAIAVGAYVGKRVFINTTVAIEASKPVKPDLRSTEEKLGYVQVQIFEFADEVAEIPAHVIKKAENTVVASTTEIKEIKEVKEEKKEPVKPTPPPAKPVAQVAKKVEQPAKVIVPPAQKKYSIVFEDLTGKEYDTVNALAIKFKAASEITDSVSTKSSFWRVYRVNPKAKTVVGGKNVEKVADFHTKEEAVAYAKSNNIQSVIKFEEEINRSYSLRLCCTDLENSKKLAEESNIRNKTIKIVREE